jgi:hypothetical protein
MTLTEDARIEMVKIIKVLALALAFLILGMSLSRCSPPPPAPAVIVEAPKSSVVKNEEQVEVALKTPNKTIKTYKADLKKKLPIPKEAVANDNIQVTDSVIVPASERPTYATSSVDLTTGETTTHTAPAPRPWFAVENRGAIALDYGLKRGAAAPVIRLNGRYDLVQTKALHWGVSGSAFSDGDYFGGAGVEYRW